MAWRWWWRRRGWPRRRRWRWRRSRRLPRRRPRRARRPARRTRVRRWRRKRGWRRRKYIRGRLRRKKRRKINLTQWNPAIVRKCVVKGYLPLLICGTGTTGTTYKNYASNANNYVKIDPFGGGVSTMMFTLQNLFEELQKCRNTWSRTNENLELIRYRGCKFTIYRHPTADFILQYNRKQPFVDSQLTAPYLHPGLAMLRKRKKLIPSFQTKPKGRSTIKFKVPPPTLFNDRWYFQRDFCKLPLVTLGASVASLRFPFCSPQTDNICITFQVLHPLFYSALSITHPHPETLWTSIQTRLTNTWSTLGTKGGPWGTTFNTFYTQEHIQEPPANNYKQPQVNSPTYYTKTNSHWGDHVYKSDIVGAMRQNQQKMYEARANQTYSESAFLNYKTGCYSAIFLSNSRLAPDFPGLYWEAVYNPLNDKGVGNKVWIDWCTKNDTTFYPNQTNLVIEDLPLWAALLGYRDYCTKHFKTPGFSKEARLTIICPYTEPPLFDKDNTDKGFVPYDYNFGNTKMPDGNGYIPLAYRFKWYICMFHQQNFMNDIVQSGPFAYHGAEKSVTLTAKYRFTFLFGGNPAPTQAIKDPCKQPDFPIPGTSGQPPRLQVTNPKLLHEGYYFKAWDLRHGFFGAKAIKRMQEQQINAEFFTGPPKRPRFEVPAMQDENSNSLVSRRHPWETESETESQSEKEAPQETSPQTTIQLRLQQQLREQKQLGRTVQSIIQQLIKTQHHLHVPIIH
nr:MAG: ORF1 [Torque teno virus]